MAAACCFAYTYAITVVITCLALVTAFSCLATTIANVARQEKFK